MLIDVPAVSESDCEHDSFLEVEFRQPGDVSGVCPDKDGPDDIDEFLLDLESRLKDILEGLEFLGASMGDCSGVEAREFQTPSISGSSSMALAPKGISSLDLILSLTSARSMSPVCAFVSFRTFKILWSLTKPARVMMTTC